MTNNMRNKTKHRYIIQQQIRIRASIKQKRRQKPRKKKQVVEAVQIPRVPRQFRRYRNSSSTNFLANKTNAVRHKKIDFLHSYLPDNLKYITEIKDSPFNLKDIGKEKYNSQGVITIPERFSVLDNPDESYMTLRKVISALLLENSDTVTLDYQNCKNTELSTQILLDIILIDFVKFQVKCQKTDRQRRNLFPIIGANNINDETVKKMMFSVGSPVNLGLQ